MNEYRTNTCGELRSQHIGQKVCLTGWLQDIRNLGKILFITIRDESGVTQVRINQTDIQKEILQTPKETLIMCKGVVKSRGKKNENAALNTGEVEVELTSYKILAESCSTTLMNISDKDAEENIELKSRYLALRNPELHRNILFRSQFIAQMRKELISLGFNELQIFSENNLSPDEISDIFALSNINANSGTILDYLTNFTANQRQLLMATGFERIFQIKPRLQNWDGSKYSLLGQSCQLDIEVNFVTQEKLLTLIETVFTNAFKALNLGSLTSFSKITQSDSLFKYGSPIPNLRLPMKTYDLTLFLKNLNYLKFKKGFARALITPNSENHSHSFFQRLVEQVKLIGINNISWGVVGDNHDITGPLSKLMLKDDVSRLINICNAKSGSIIFFLNCQQTEVIEKAIAEIRYQLTERLGASKQVCHIFSWITDFHMFDLRDKNLTFACNPFSMPQVNSKLLNLRNALNIKTHQYDLIYNGAKIGTGSIRNNDLRLIQGVFDIAGYHKEMADEKNKNLLEIFSLGMPLHGGITLDLDKLIMSLLHTSDFLELTPFLNQNNIETTEKNNKVFFPTKFNASLFLNYGSSIEDFELENEMQKIIILEKKQITTLLKSKTKSMGLTSRDYYKYEVLEKLLPDFSMSPEDVNYILNLLPQEKTRILKLPPEEIFQFLWSILGNDHVKAWLKEPKLRQQIKNMVEMGVITDYKQLRFIHPETMKAFNVLLRNYTKKMNNSEYLSKMDYNENTLINYFAKTMRTILANMPNDFSTILTTLKHNSDLNNNLLMHKKDRQILLDAARDGCCSPIFFSIYRQLYPNKDKVLDLITSIRSLYLHIYPHQKIDSRKMRQELKESLSSTLGSSVKGYFENYENVLSETIYHLFKPINMDIYSVSKHLKHLKDCTSDIKALGIKFGGRNWNKDLGCYQFLLSEPDPAKETIQIYFSKNTASFFAKASAGICTLNDLELFQRKDHFHMNLVDSTTHITVGNVQMYLLKNKNKRILLLRAINPSDSYVTKQNALSIVKTIFLAAIEVAKKSNIDEVCVSESLGIWHAQSSRPEIQAILELLYKAFPSITLDSPFCLYNYQNKPIYIRNIFRVWDK